MFPEFRSSKFLLAMVLLGIAWPGPRLVVHSHDEIACSPISIREHIRVYHQDCLAGQPAPRGVHFHWVFACGEPSDPAVFPAAPQQSSWAISASSYQVGFDLADGIYFSFAALSEAPDSAPSVSLFQTRHKLWLCPSRSHLCVWNC